MGKIISEFCRCMDDFKYVQNIVAAQDNGHRGKNTRGCVSVILPPPQQIKLYSLQGNWILYRLTFNAIGVLLFQIYFAIDLIFHRAISSFTGQKSLTSPQTKCGIYAPEWTYKFLSNMSLLCDKVQQLLWASLLMMPRSVLMLLSKRKIGANYGHIVNKSLYFRYARL